MISIGLAIAMVCTPSLCEEANKALFEQWGTTLHIPEITIGVPADQTIEDSFVLLDEIYADLVASTQGDLSSEQRALVVPFAMGMIEGIRASQGDEAAAKLCVQHLSELEDAVSGWSASRLWRMRLHAYVCLNMDEEVQSCINNIDETTGADVEDQLVAALCGGQNVLLTLDRTLSQQNKNDLRWFFACGVVAKQPDHLPHLFSVANNVVRLGVDRIAIDEQLIAVLARLDPPIEVETSSTQKNVALLARRTIANACIEQQKYKVAKEKLLELTQHGCGYSAQQLLTTTGIKLQRNEANIAIELVLKNPDETSYELSYWQLFAGSHFARTGDKNKASECLQSVSNTSQYFEEAQALLALIRGSDVRSLQTKIDKVAKNGKSIGSIIEEIQPAAAKQLLQHYVGVWHEQGTVQNPWLSNVLVGLLDKPSGISKSLLGEANRLLGRVHEAKQFLEQAKREQGGSLQVAVGLAACDRDPAAMRSATHGLVHGTKNDYWFWLANARMIQWYCEDGGNKMKAQAKVNRLKQLDPTLGGEQFASVFRDALR